MSDEPKDRPQESGSRLTPYELVFGPEIFEEDRFPEILHEAEERGVDPAEAERFLMLGQVGRLMGALLPEDAPGAAVEQYGRLLFHAFHFWRFDRRLFVLDRELARELARRPPRIGAWELVPPHPAGYLQLPRHLFWARVEEGATPEPVDGLFWSMVGEDNPAQPPYGHVDVLLALGVRPDRPGISVVEVGESLDAAKPQGHWGDTDARPEGRDFANILPGGELEELHALVTPAEVLKLLSLVFWYAAEHPDAVGPRQEAEGGPPTEHGMPRSALPFERIRRVDADG